MVLGAFGEGIGPAHQAAGPGSPRAEPTLHMGGLAFLFAAGAVGSLWKRRRVSIPEVAPRGAAAIIPGNGCLQVAGALQTSIPKRPAHDLARSSAKGYPQPELAGFAADKAPEFIEFKHIAVFSGQQRVHEGRKTLRFFPPPTAARFYSRRQRYE